jgi:hypothetical protein
VTRRPPDLDELLGGLEDEEERARLKRVHELLVEAGPPPELSPTLQAPPPASARVLPWQRPRRIRPRTALALGVVVTAFFVGYLAGSSGNEPQGSATGLRILRTVQLDGKGDATGAIGVGARDESGNWRMIVSVWGLDHLFGRDYYSVALTREGKPVVTCGTFNVSGDQTTVRMIAAYQLDRFDGWVVLRWNAKTREDTVVLSSGGKI